MAFPVRIEPMAETDIASVVRLQLGYLEGSVVTELGGGFLTRFHSAALAHPAACAVVARDPGGRIVGFAVASRDVAAFNRHVKPRVIVPLALALLAPSRFRVIPSVLRSLGESPPRPYIPTELLLLVVDPSARRCGAGRALLGALEENFGRHGVERYRVAVRSHLSAARAFYQALAFEHEQERLVLGRPMVYLTKRVAPPVAGGRA
jgi:GNAT superfamily N-acetyltransferase